MFQPVHIIIKNTLQFTIVLHRLLNRIINSLHIVKTHMSCYRYLIICVGWLLLINGYSYVHNIICLLTNKIVNCIMSYLLSCTDNVNKFKQNNHCYNIPKSYTAFIVFKYRRKRLFLE